jgi:hypothetical protein
MLHNFAPTFDFCLIQEHWLFSQQIGLLNFDCDFDSCGVSGIRMIKLCLEGILMEDVGSSIFA